MDGPKSIMLSTINQIEKDKHCMTSPMCKNEQNKNRVTKIKTNKKQVNKNKSNKTKPSVPQNVINYSISLCVFPNLHPLSIYVASYQTKWDHYHIIL